MATPHYSLRWNNHQNHILHAFDTLLQNETLVDVTLVCEETSVKAHKVVLSACSPYFQRIFSENPCKHPVIVLKDLQGWEVQAIVDFMYKGEISVGEEQLSSLIKAAESLQVRGLTHTDTVVSEKENAHSTSYSPPLEKLGVFPNHVRTFASHLHDKDNGLTILSPFSPPSHYEPSVKLPALPHMPHISFSENPLPPGDHTSPQPRRKQASNNNEERLLSHEPQTARPRRRSGDLCGAQDLSKGPTTPPQLETAENLSMKKSTTLQPLNNNIVNNNNSSNNNAHHVNHQLPQPQLAHSTPVSSPHPPPPSFKIESEEQQQQLAENARESMHTPEQEREREGRERGRDRERDRESRERERDRDRDRESRERERERDRAEYCNSLESLGLTPQPPDSSMDNSSFPHLPSMSALSLTPPHMFSLDSPLGFFPGMDACRNPLLNDIHQEPRNDNHHIMGKRKMGRPKGQHSAPRGGPPRSWTNAELTEALQHVWNKKMTTSQASRIFGIPYNSLLMYVRGKYGKSLKLEQLKKDCLGSPGGPLELLGLGPMGPIGSNNNNNNTGKSNHPDDLGMPSEHDLLPHGFNPYSAANFYPDFTGSFPIPVSMIHLLPQSEKNRELFAHGLPHLVDMSPKDEDCKSSSGRRSRDNNSSGDEDSDLIHPQITLPREDITQLIEQNGQN